MTTITTENVKFNGVTENAAVLKNSGGIKTLILTDDLPAGSRSALDTFVAKYGSNPLAGPTAGKLTAKFPASTVGGTSTGLMDTAATAGKAVVVTSSTVSLGASSFLYQETGSRGLQTLRFSTVGPNGETGVVAGRAAQSGYQRVVFTGSINPGDPTGLPNTGSLFEATVSFDGVTPIQLSVAGSAAQTFGTLMTYIDGVMVGGAASLATVDGVPCLTFTSSTTGVSSTVEIVDDSLFSGLSNFVEVEAAVDGTASTLANYTLLVSVDGAAAQTLTISNEDIGTVDDIATAIAETISGADAFVENDKTIVIKSNTAGNSSSIRVTGGTLLLQLPRMSAGFPVPGSTKFARTYSAVIVVDDRHVRTINASGVGLATYGDVITAINADLGGVATAAIVSGALTITSATTGANSSVVIQDTGFLFSSLQNYQSIVSTPGTDARVYTAFLEVDGVTVPISITGSTALTFTNLLSQINTDLGSAATAALTGGSIVVTSATTGLASTIKVVLDDLFKHVTGFDRFEATNGAVDLVDEMQKTRVGGGTLFDLFDVKRVGVKPAVPPVPATLPKTQAFSYYGGTPAAWRYLEDDAEVNP